MSPPGSCRCRWPLPWPALVCFQGLLLLAITTYQARDSLRDAALGVQEQPLLAAQSRQDKRKPDPASPQLRLASGSPRYAALGMQEQPLLAAQSRQDKRKPDPASPQLRLASGSPRYAALGMQAPGLSLHKRTSNRSRWSRVHRQSNAGMSRRSDSTLASTFSDAACMQACPNCSFIFEGPAYARGDYLLMFNYGKVASNTMQNALQPLLGRPVQYLPEIPKRFPPAVKTHAAGVAKRFLQQVPRGKRVWILTASRNPFEWLVSAFFQNFKIRTFRWIKEANLSHVPVQELLDHFPSDAASLAKPYDRRTAWTESFFSGGFDNTVGVDLAACSGRFASSLYVDFVARGRRHSIVVLRLEDVKMWPKSMSGYFPGFAMPPSRNVLDDVPWHQLPQEFEARWVWPEQDVRRILLWDTWAFYTVEEKLAMLQALKRATTTSTTTSI